MFITICIPTYNRAYILERAINSVISQSESDWELLIIDDGSTDNTYDIVLKYLIYKNIHYVKKENGGKHSALNVGVKRAEGEYFLILDSDDYLSKDCIRKMKEILNIYNQDDVCGVVGKCVNISKNSSYIGDLFDKEGIDHANEPIAVSRREIASFIEEKIREGVKNFFAALLLSYQNDKVKKPATVNILLAGNSCKSPIVKKVFEEEIEEQRNDIKEKLNIQGDVGKLFEIFPPLGTPDAYRKMEERGISYSEDDFERPTGKTGVAFGLIQCRDGGSVERISSADTSSEIPFQFFIGWKTKRKFEIFRGNNKPTKYLGRPDYNEWYQFIEADASTFYLYYTTLPECVNGNAAVKRLKCTIDVVDENANVYIRATGPHTIQYTVSSGDDVEKCRKGEIYTKEMG